MLNKSFQVAVCALFIALFIADASAAPYFSANKISPTLLNPPLDRVSAKYEQEVTKIIAMQKSPDSLEINLSKEEVILSPELVGYQVDNKLSRKDYPKLYRLLDRSFETAVAVTENCKNYWNTKRPFLSEEKIKALVTPYNNPSYPSGHTSSSHVLAKILGQLIPKKAEDFALRAEQISNHRILVGMHFPHDIEGGKQLSSIMLGALFLNDDFLADYKAAKKEIAANYK